MTLTKEDLSAIRGIVEEEIKTELVAFEAKMDEKFVAFELKIDEKFAAFELKIDAKLEPLRDALKELLLAQIEIVDRSRALRKTLKDLH